MFERTCDSVILATIRNKEASMERTRRSLLISFIAISLSALAVYANPILGHCVPNVGEFTFVDGRLAIKIAAEDDKPVRPHTEFVANPPGAEEAEQLTHRGLVRFKAHLECEGGRVVVHWATVRNVADAQSR